MTDNKANNGQKKQMENMDYISKLEMKNEKLIVKRGYQAGYDLAKKSVKIMAAEIIVIVLWLLMQTVNGPLNTLPFEVFIIPIGLGVMAAFEVFNIVTYVKLARVLKEREEKHV